MVGTAQQKVALTIAGFDPSGGAGVLADLRVFAAHGLYGQACITTMTVQSTQGVVASRPQDAAWVSQTLAALAADNPFHVIKIGALGSAAVVFAVSEFVASQPGVPVVLDPVMRSTSGADLLDADGILALEDHLLPLVGWLTPNLAEAKQLARAADELAATPESVTSTLQTRYPEINILVTGGELESVADYLRLAGGAAGQWIPGRRIHTAAGHGTGCTLSSALACRLVLHAEEAPEKAVAACKRYVEGALENAPGLGRGAGPLNHFWATALDI